MAPYGVVGKWAHKESRTSWVMAMRLSVRFDPNSTNFWLVSDRCWPDVGQICAVSINFEATLTDFSSTPARHRQISDRSVDVEPSLAVFGLTSVRSTNFGRNRAEFGPKLWRLLVTLRFMPPLGAISSWGKAPAATSETGAALVRLPTPSPRCSCNGCAYCCHGWRRRAPESVGKWRPQTSSRVRCLPTAGVNRRCERDDT